VEPGSLFENGALSSGTRSRLLQRKALNNPALFEEAKYEVQNDIFVNPTLRSIVEKHCGLQEKTSGEQ
jgi:hypothetical protein